MTYTSYKELKGKILMHNDRVHFGDDENDRYNVWETFLNCDGGINHRVFNSCGIGAKEYQQKLANVAYGYKCGSGDWPTAKTRDFDALTRLALVILQFCEGQETATIDFDNGSRIKVNKQGEVISKAIDKDHLLVPAEFVRAAHKSACNEWKKKIQTQFPSLFDSFADLSNRIDSYPFFQKGKIQTLLRTHIHILEDGNDYYVIVELPSANKHWTFQAYDFARWFVSGAKDISRVDHAYPVHYESTFKMISEKFSDISLGGCIAIKVVTKKI